MTDVNQRELYERHRLLKPCKIKSKETLAAEQQNIKAKVLKFCKNMTRDRRAGN